MGSIGKTTVAQLVYNDKRFVHKEFKLRVWVSVSMDLDMKKIIKTIIESITGGSCTLSDFNSLHVTLQEILASRVGKFLLVLDDFWSEIDEEWDFLFALIRHGCEGSKVIVTTRSKRVSTLVGSFKTYNLKTLSDDDCWRLMKKTAFREREENFESLGIEIEKKCNGLPLAAKVIGNVLYRQCTEDEWNFILKSDLWDLPRDQNRIIPSLMLSYLHLPAHLQKCFAYCSMFHQNYKFEAKELVLLWMAEGFIQPTGGEKKLEDIGVDYFNDLYSRCFFLLCNSSSPSQMIYKMHDLLRNLAQLVSADTCLQMKHEISRDYSLFGNTYHLSLHHDDYKTIKLKASNKNDRLRTFLILCKNQIKEGSLDKNLLSNLKFVRVLGLSDIGIQKLPDTVEHLIYLRYLNLSGNKIKRLPKSLCKLLALQTLKLLKNLDLIFLPNEISNLFNLRHLEFDIDGKINFMPKEFGKLTNLQTLSAYIVRKTKGHGIEELKNMENLRGSLSIKNLENVSNHADATNAKLEMKSDLTELKLLWEDSNGIALADQELVLTNLRPHKNLKKLTIKKYGGSKCPNWLCDSIHKFTRIELQGLPHCTELPSFGQLPLLELLYIGEMPSLKTIDDNFYGNGNSGKFPSLVSLELYQMTELVCWTDSSKGTSMPQIKNFKLEDCKKLTSLPSKLKDLPNKEISRCGSLLMTY